MFQLVGEDSHSPVLLPSSIFLFPTMYSFQPRKLFVLAFIGLLYQCFQCCGAEFLYKQGVRQWDHILVILLSVVIIWTAGQCIRAVQRSRPVMNFEVVVC